MAGGETSSLLTAAANGSVRGARVSLQQGAAVNARDADGRTAVSIAAEQGHMQLLRCLLEANADVVHAIDVNGWSPIMWAARSGKADAVAEICRSVGDDDSFGSPDDEDAAGLQSVARQQQVLEAVNYDGSNALMVAASCGHAVVVATLLAAGANPLAASAITGSTALHLAASCGNGEVLELLLEAERCDAAGRWRRAGPAL